MWLGEKVVCVCEGAVRSTGHITSPPPVCYSHSTAAQRHMLHVSTHHVILKPTGGSCSLLGGACGWGRSMPAQHQPGAHRETLRFSFAGSMQPRLVQLEVLEEESAVRAQVRQKAQCSASSPKEAAGAQWGKLLRSKPLICRTLAL